MEKNKLLIIDPQNDFCSPNGALYVKNAENDMDNLKNFIINHIEKINEIHITQDVHNLYDIAHPVFWVDKNDKHPAPFSIITYDDFKNKKFIPKVKNENKYVKHYLINTQKNNKQPLCIWPEHCIMKTEGFEFYPPIQKIINIYKEKIFTYKKGYYPKSEHFSAIDAELPYINENINTRNNKLISNIQNNKINKLIIAGEASSHCLGATIKDIIIDPEININLSKIYILNDATSPVKGFESQEKEYFDYFKKNNINIISMSEMENLL